MTKGQKRQRRYSICFKQKVVAELQRGISVPALSRKYGISGSTTVKKWVLQYGSPELLNEVVYVKMRKEADEVQSLRKEVRRLKVALADETMISAPLTINHHLLRSSVKLGIW